MSNPIAVTNNMFTPVSTEHGANNSFEVNVSGPYYVGDPCYCFSHDTTTWSEFCDSMDKSCQGIFTNKNRSKSIIGLSTMYGDGCYGGVVKSVMHEFPVDAGILGIVPMADVEVGSSFTQNNKLGCIIFLDEGSVVSRSKDGEFTITCSNGDVLVSIFTGDDEEQDDDHYGDHDEDDCY